MTVSCQRGAVMYCTNYNHEGKDEWGDDAANNDVGKLASKDRVKRKHSHKCYIYIYAYKNVVPQCLGAYRFTILYKSNAENLGEIENTHLGRSNERE